MESRVASIVVISLMVGLYLLEFKVPIIAAVGIAGLGFCIYLFAHMRIDNLGVLTLANYGYWIWSALLVGSVAPLDFVSQVFLSGEGRIFISYTPLLFLSVVAVREHNLIIFYRLVLVLAVITLLLFAVWVPTHARFLSEGAAGNFVAFLTSHTGGGTFFGAMSMLLILYGYESRRRMALLLGCLMFMPLFASASRSSLLGCLVVAVWYFLKMKNWRVFLFGGLIMALGIGSMPFVAPHTWNRSVSLFDPVVFDNIVQTARTSTWAPGDSEDELELAGGQVNVLFRIAVWTYAVNRFLDSPLLGIGYGRYNDYDLQMTGVPGVIYMASDGVKTLGVGNAHNSFFHVLCESGLIGFGLLVCLWLYAYFRLQKGIRRYANLKDMVAFFTAAQGVIVFSLVAGLTGHALAAPSLGIPALTTIGLAIALLRHLDNSVVVSRKPLLPTHDDGPPQGGR